MSRYIQYSDGIDCTEVVSGNTDGVDCTEMVSCYSDGIDCIEVVSRYSDGIDFIIIIIIIIKTSSAGPSLKNKDVYKLLSQPHKHLRHVILKKTQLRKVTNG